MKKKPSSFLGWVAVVLALVLLSGLLSVGINYWVYQDIQKRLEIKANGRYIPSVFVPSFRLENATFNWEDKVRLVEGSIKVRFDLMPLLSGRGIRIVAESTGAKIKFLGSWALQEGIEDATVDTLYADVILGRRGLAGINTIEARSPSFQFSLKNVDKKG